MRAIRNFAAFRPSEEMAAQAMERFAPILEKKRAGMKASAKAYRARPKDAADPVLGALARDGVASVRLPAGLMGQLRDAAAPHAARLKAGIEEALAASKPVRFMDTLLPILQKNETENGADALVETVRTVLTETEINAVSADYFPGLHVSDVRASVKYNFAGHDMHMPMRRARANTGGMHIDSNSRAMMNGVLYLSEVGPDQGPFCYVLGSNHWVYDVEDRAIRKAIDETGFGAANGEKYFASLPAEFQRKAAFGWDLADDSTESTSLLSGERKHCGDVADLVWFDADGVHRGGFVHNGFRLAILIQLIMRPRPRDAA